MPDAIVSRTIQDVSGSPVSIEIFAPSPTEHELHWRCMFEIRGAAITRSDVTVGVDGFQAMLFALDAVRMILAQSGFAFTFLGNDWRFDFPRLEDTLTTIDALEQLRSLVDEKIRAHYEDAYSKPPPNRRKPG